MAAATLLIKMCSLWLLPEVSIKLVHGGSVRGLRRWLRSEQDLGCEVVSTLGKHFQLIINYLFTTNA
jgi:hypothetical protein